VAWLKLSGDTDAIPACSASSRRPAPCRLPLRKGQVLRLPDRARSRSQLRTALAAVRESDLRRAGVDRAWRLRSDRPARRGLKHASPGNPGCRLRPTPSSRGWSMWTATLGPHQN